MVSPYQYDAYISYTYGDADEAFARTLHQILESDGYKTAIDQRDFASNATFLNEMERCIGESRHVIAIISARTFDSSNIHQDAVMRVIRDMDTREHRLIPIIIDKSQMPLWIFSLTGVNYMEVDPLAPPFERIKAVLGNPL